MVGERYLEANYINHFLFATKTLYTRNSFTGFFVLWACYNSDMTSTPKYEEDNWMRFTDESTEINDEIEEEDDVDDLDIPSWANVTAEL